MLLAAAITIAFRPALDGAFLNWDDDRNFELNEQYRGLGAAQAEWAWNTYHLGVWQPLSWLLLGAEYAIGGMNPRVYNAFGLLLHIVNAVLLYFVAVRLVRLARPAGEGAGDPAVQIGAAAAALLFAVHPLRVEAVAWKSCQPYLPAVCVYMLAMLWYLRGGEDGGEARRWSRIGGAFVLYLVAVMFKAVAVTLPAVLLLLDIWLLRRMGGKAGWFNRRALGVWLEKIPFLAVAILVSIWAAAAKDYGGSRLPMVDFNADAQFAQSAYGAVFYLMKTLWPSGLHAYYRLPDGVSLAAWPYGFCAIVVLGVSVAAFVLRRRVPGLLVAWLAYFVILLPNLGLVQFSQQIAADRYGYLATIPLFVLLAGGLARLFCGLRKQGSAWRFAAAACLLAICIALVAKTWAQSKTWQDSKILWQRVLSYDPDCAVAECNLGTAHLMEGRHREASRHLSRAIDLCDGFAFAYANFGTLLLDGGRYDEAIACYSIALEGAGDLNAADLAKVHAGIGEAYASLGAVHKAWEHTIEARRLGFAPADRMLERLKPLLDEKPRGGP